MSSDAHRTRTPQAPMCALPVSAPAQEYVAAALRGKGRPFVEVFNKCREHLSATLQNGNWAGFSRLARGVDKCSRHLSTVEAAPIRARIVFAVPRSRYTIARDPVTGRRRLRRCATWRVTIKLVGLDGSPRGSSRAQVPSDTRHLSAAQGRCATRSTDVEGFEHRDLGEAIAYAAHRLDVVAGGAHLLAEAFHVCVHGTGRNLGVDAPHFVEQRTA